MKNIFRKSNIITTLVVGICMSTATSCSLTGAIFEGNEELFNDKLTEYLRKDLPVVRISSEKYAAYFDFTGAMTACSDLQTEQTFNGLCQKITGDAANFDIYKLGDSKITPLTGEIRPTQIFAQLKNAKSQVEFYAPIENTLKKIASEGRSSVLVTDFEEYTSQGQIYRQAYATPYFKSWLASGGDITFFVTDYTEGSIQKHLYYVVFDYNEHSLLKLVEQGLQGLPQNYKRFTLATNSYPMGTKYLAESKGGTYHDEAGDDVVSMSVEDGSDNAFLKVKGLRAESYCFGADWPDIITNAKGQTRENGFDGKDGNAEPFSHLFRNLFIDLSHSDSYKLNSLDVRVTEIKDDFEKYWAWHIASKNKPKIEKEEGKIYLDFEGHEEGEEYYGEKGNILPEYDYTRGPGKIVEIKDMLVFDNELFKNTYAQSPATVELGIKFKPEFTGEILQLKGDDHIFRVDIIVQSASICNQNTLQELFGWPGNDCLFYSVKNALQDMNPQGHPIYSYFIRIQ